MIWLKKQAVILILAVALMGMVSGCSSYGKRWERWRSMQAGKSGLAGSYEGKWKSTRYRAGGNLWCILRPISPEAYLADFRATWHGVFASEHTVVLMFRGKEERLGDGKLRSRRFDGEADIKMWIGSGRYRCEGEVEWRELEVRDRRSGTGAGGEGGVKLKAKYDAGYDSGTLELLRVR